MNIVGLTVKKSCTQYVLHTLRLDKLIDVLNGEGHQTKAGNVPGVQGIPMTAPLKGNLFLFNVNLSTICLKWRHLKVDELWV